METPTNPEAIAASVRTAIQATLGSVRAAAKETGIPGTTLDRRLKHPDTFTVGELQRLAHATGHEDASSFLGGAS